MTTYLTGEQRAHRVGCSPAVRAYPVVGRVAGVGGERGAHTDLSAKAIHLEVGQRCCVARQVVVHQVVGGLQQQRRPSDNHTQTARWVAHSWQHMNLCVL